MSKQNPSSNITALEGHHKFKKDNLIEKHDKNSPHVELSFFGKGRHGIADRWHCNADSNADISYLYV
jgi:hypothetical protein